MSAPALNTAIVAEKPSVARDIAAVVGARTKGDGFLHGGGYVVTWAIGHLVQLAQPHEIRPEWKAWRRDQLPMLPAGWPLMVNDQTRDQFEVVRKILTSPKIGDVVCATDAGREGELIFRYIYEAAACDKPVRRLWISSLTADAIQQGLANLKPGADYDPLADAARGRSRADWLVGMNLSRAYTIALGENFSVGRVQTPTLAMLVARELEIRAFVPEDYIEVVATFSPDDGASKYQGTWFRAGDKPPRESMRLTPDGDEAQQIVARAKSGVARVESVTGETQRMAPPFLYDLTELQRHANRLFGFSAQKTLEVAQALYEKHKLLSYPRTDSRHLSNDVARTLPAVVNAISAPYQADLAPGTGSKPLSKRYVDDTKVTDHHAIIPTPTRAKPDSLDRDEQRLYDLVCRRLLQAWHDDHIWRVTTVITAITNPGFVDQYLSTGTLVEQIGWKVLDLKPSAKKQDANAEPALPPGLRAEMPVLVLDAEAQRKKTRPPKRFTEATLLTAMESAGKTLDDKELSDAMKETGLGTPATRASIIEVLLTRGYAERDGKSLMATNKGIHLIEVVHDEVKSPVMTGQWEARLQRIHRGKDQLAPFMQGIEEYVTEVVGRALHAKPREARIEIDTVEPLPEKRSSAGQPLDAILRERFGHPEFRPGQEAICRTVAEGHDALVVMPTGAGKSLCYQLPGLARGGTTLVVSPLIALMEDQVSKLREQGIRAERLHSGLARPASRQICHEYLNGELDFLYIAPERFRVPGFPEMLAKVRPALIAIDEAHCISQWGHDFRPDYRRIGQYLEWFRPAPVIALTATATPRVQHDIAGQLGLQGERFIQGFWRDNIAIEAVESLPSLRHDLAAEILSGDGRLPSIIYTPSRREAEDLAESLSARGFRAAAYHAGLDKERRTGVQARFQQNQLDVTVATIAFGMGIDKPDIRTVIHTSTPGSMESYYQEIGRAGRDGLPSRAILMQSYADRRTHDFFFERDYPEPSEVARIYSKLGPHPIPKEELQAKCRGLASFDTALDKLYTYGGALIDAEENVARGAETWREDYEEQRDNKLAQLEEILRFADTNQCRMAVLVRHFGDLKAARDRCGHCDFCAPESCIAQSFRDPTSAEKHAAEAALKLIRRSQNYATGGKLFQETAGALDRNAFERVLGGLARGGWIRIEEASFDKDGKTIPFRKVFLTPDGDSLEDGELPEFTIVEVTESQSKSKAKSKTKTKAKKATAPAAAPREPDSAAQAKEKALKAWRLAEARKQGLPAFRILTDAVVRAIALDSPADTSELLAIPGMGPRGVEKYGAAILGVLK